MFSIRNQLNKLFVKVLSSERMKYASSIGYRLWALQYSKINRSRKLVRFLHIFLLNKRLKTT